MGIAHEHEIHKRRLSRNLGVGLTLLAFVAIVFGLTIVKVSNGDMVMDPEAAQTGGANGN